MVDKKLEEKIKNTKAFLEMWSKFHTSYRNALTSIGAANSQREHFLSTKSLIDSKFQELMDLAEVKTDKRFTSGFPVYEILSIEGLSTISDEKLKKMDDSWNESYIFLSQLLNRFQKKRRRIEKFNRFFFMFKNFLRKGARHDKERNRIKNI